MLTFKIIHLRGYVMRIDFLKIIKKSTVNLLDVKEHIF